MTKFRLLNTTALGLLLFATGCQSYLDRSEGVTSTAGNHLAVNEAKMVVDPWPPYADNTHLHGDGERLGDAVERYKKSNAKEENSGDQAIIIPTGSSE